ncbi:cytochrome c, class I [Ideonella sp.]|uniref:SorB family sulfite dehydrogenase c-type cytochrome subunit n=1 Tax=Ideonella sp. TaxID=1929293 RepID=UPI0035B3644D
MSKRMPLVPALVVAAATLLGGIGNAFAVVKTMAGPPDTVVLQPSPLPGYQKAMTSCTSCHSAEYMQYQPPTAPRKYWDAMVHRMKTVFKAPIDDADMPAIVDYLTKTYGAERPK